MGVCSTFAAVLVVAIAIAASTPYFNGDANKSIEVGDLDVPSMRGQNVIITGASSGVGKDAAGVFASKGARVFVTSRSLARATSTASSIDGHVVPLALDLTSLSSVSDFAAALRQELDGGQIDILILNAGGFYPLNDFTGPFVTQLPGGEYDSLVTGNHLGHFYLVSLLRDLLASSATRVVFTSSISHWLGTESAAGFDTVYSKGITPTGAFALYGQTKLMNVLMAYKLQRELPSTSVAVCTPGFVSTNIGSSNREPEFRPLDYLPLARSSTSGGAVLVAAAVTPIQHLTGKMLQPYWIWEGAVALGLTGVKRGAFYNFIQEMLLQRLTPEGRLYAHVTNPLAYDEALQDKLWDWSARAVGL